ncbi:helix-turn-helix domain-containing protein [Shewanella sp. FJAT-52076]|nr:helix-turn-helix domain-containing protein [Shewanella sp. FJAT-52076]
MTVFQQLPSAEICQRARLSRDARFDGLFFTGVFSTGIYCRPICPATAPKEENVRYFASAQAAAAQGLRPCLRCRPESAPGSSPWRGTATTLSRAMALIDAGALNATDEHTSEPAQTQAQAMEALAERVGVGSRYLRKLFGEQLGMSPKAYGDYRRLLLAKALLHQTSLPITDVAFAAGFGSVRRFNEVFRERLALTPSDIRAASKVQDSGIRLHLGFRPPYDFMRLRAFFMARAIPGAEWFSNDAGEPCYGRTLRVAGDAGWFEACLLPDKNTLAVTIYPGGRVSTLSQWLAEIKRVLDVDANLSLIHEHIQDKMPEGVTLNTMTLPGAGSFFEAACRAVLGQQVSLVQATRLLGLLTDETTDEVELGGRRCRVFPTAEQVASATLESLKMPGSRKNALREMAALFSRDPQPNDQALLAVKGVGPWTVSYARMRGLSDPDVLLVGDLVVKQKLCAMGWTKVPDTLKSEVSPWGSYLTLALWHTEV